MPEVDDPHHAGVLDRRQQQGLAAKALADIGGQRQVFAQHFERHLATERDLLGEVDQAHASAAEQLLDPKAAVEHQRARGQPHLRGEMGLGQLRAHSSTTMAQVTDLARKHAWWAR